MRPVWTMAALVAAVLIVGCGDSRPDTNTAQNPAEDAPDAGEEQAAVAESPPSVIPPAPPATSGAERRRIPANSRPVNAPASVATERPVAPAVPAPAWREVTIPAGTALLLELRTALSSETAKVETPVSARLRETVVIDGDAILPAGSTLTGHVSEVERPGRVQGVARLALRFTEIAVGDTRYTLRTEPIVFVGEATKGKDATKIGAAAGIGAALGGLLGGGDGAAKGAAIGGAAGTGVVLATRGREIEVAPGHAVDASLAEAMTVSVPAP